MFNSQQLPANLIQGDSRFNDLVKEAMNKIKNNDNKEFLPAPEKTQSEIRTVRSILWKKFLDVFEKSELSKILSFFSMSVLSVSLAMTLTYPEEAREFFWRVAALENYIIPKFFCSVLGVFSLPKIVRVVRDAAVVFKFWIEIDRGGGEIENEIEGIPINALLDHLFERKTFKRNEVETKFSVPRNRFTRLAKKLDNLGVMRRGENNSRILNEDFTRGQLFDILEGKSPASEVDDSPTLPVFHSQSIGQTALAT